MLLTATRYHARLLKAQGQQAISLRDLCAWRLEEQGVSFLSPFAEWQLWQAAVQHIDYPNLDALARACQDTFEAMLLHQIPMEALADFDQAGLNVFKKVLERFLAKTDLTFLEALKHVKIQQSYHLVGFVSFPALYQAVFPQVGIKSRNMSGVTPTISASVWQASHVITEFKQALVEIEHLWQANPQQTFALVVNPEALSWQTIQRLLKCYTGQLRINCSKDECLRDLPKFKFIQDLFSSRFSKDLKLFSRVLLANFWQDDLERRAKLDVWLRERMPTTTSLTDVLSALLFHDATLQESEWFKIWEHVAQFESDQLESAVNLIMQAASFIPSSQDGDLNNINLHVISHSEAIDFPVDNVWLLGADQDHYPATLSQPVFLPQALLKQYGVATDIEACRATGLDEFMAITQGKAVFASLVPVIQGEEKQLCEWLQPDWHAASGAMSHANPGELDLRVAQFEPQCQVKPFSGQMVAGGSWVLKEQAECPFKAFAHFRLNVRSLGSGRELLDPLQKGSLVHTVLETIWQKLKSQETLLMLNSQERKELVARTVDAILFKQNPLQQQLIKKLERRRLIHLVVEWLKVEAERPQFTVDACEIEVLTVLKGLQFKVRLDRVDQIEGGAIVVDYKTGRVATKGWFSDRLTEPQLPLYAIQSEAIGAAFASLQPGAMGYVGSIAETGLAFDKLKTIQDWQAQLITWQAALETLANEFKQGRADVEPLNPTVCQYCDLSSLCRIKEKVNNKF